MNDGRTRILRGYLGFLLIVLTAAGAAPAAADSLWSPDSPGLFRDVKAMKVGDLVTVLVVETASSSQKASTDYDKSFEHANEAGVGAFLKLVPDLRFSSEQAGKASGETTLTGRLLAKVTVTVTRVLPNGNLEIQGQRLLQTNDEKQEITVSAVARPEDIGQDNTISSTFLSDVKIKYVGKGPGGDRQREGIISKLLKWIF